MLVDMGYITLKEVYVDGAKIESKANRYCFVWRKSVEKNKAKLESKIHGILSQIDEGIAQDSEPENEPPTPINNCKLRERIASINQENLTSEEGLIHRSRRPIEVEADFGQNKFAFDKQ